VGLFDKDLNQVTIRKLQASLPSSPASILFVSNYFESELEVKDTVALAGLECIPKLSPNVLRFTSPKGADVIEDR